MTIADLRPTDEIVDLRGRYRAFMEEHIYPNEPALDREDEDAEALVERLRGSAKEQGLWAPHMPPEAGGSSGSFLVYAHLNEEIGRSLWGQLVFGCQAPGRGQRRDPVDVRHARSRRSAGSGRSSPATSGRSSP